MKTLSQSAALAATPPVITPNVIILGILIAGVVIAGLSGKRIPLLSNLRFDLVLLLVLGMAMCTSGIGRVAALNSWSHPLSMVGYLLGAVILLVVGSVFLNIKLPFIATEQQALLWAAALIAVKVLNSVLHSLLVRG